MAAVKPVARATREAKGSPKPDRRRIASPGRTAPGPGDRFDEGSQSMARYRECLLEDLDTVMGFLKGLPAAVTFYGGARIAPSDPYFALASRIARGLVRRNVPVRTGGGPGIMEAAPRGFHEGLEGRRRGEVAARPAAPLAGGLAPRARPFDLRAQGVHICLPNEQRLNPDIDVAGGVRQFVFRKLGLWENARGGVVMPGGFGTLDELFEVWAHAVRRKWHDPLTAPGVAFWRPILDALERVAVRERGLVTKEAFAKLRVSDDAEEIASRLASAPGVRGFDEDPSRLATRLAHEVDRGLRLLPTLPEAVVFLGGERLEEADPACRALREAARRMAGAGRALRTGASRAIARSVAQGARAGDRKACVQCFALERESVPQMPCLKLVAKVADFIVHKDLVTRRAQGLVVAPGGLGTLAALFAVLTEIQTGQRPRMPIVLVGESYWRPLFDAIGQAMLSGERQLIGPKDLGLVTITDDPAAVARAFAGQSS